MRKLFLVWILCLPALGQDCNQNGIPDPQDVAAGNSADCNTNGVPDECEYGTLLLYQDFDGAPLPVGVTESRGDLWHTTNQCRPVGGGGSGAYEYFGLDASCNFHAGTVLGNYQLNGVSLPADTTILLSYWSYYEGENGGEMSCDGEFSVDAAYMGVLAQAVLDDYCNEPSSNPEWRYRTVDLSAFAGQTVDLFWQFSSDDELFNTFFGWGIDDIRIWSFEDVSGNGVPDPCERVSLTYCSSNPNSTGSVAGLAALGSVDLSDQDLFLRTVFVPQNVFGYYLMSMVQDSTPLPAPSQGNLCLGLPIVRFDQNVLQSGAIGELRMRIDFQNLPQQTVFQPGETWNFQSWFRDGATSNTSRGVLVAFQ
ncbi:MAG: hypothetical protein GY711_28900 [bacterium]|nr:hypothetical protein [bacterium]